MTTSQPGAGDPYATARSDMRDTTKWFASTFAAIAAVVVAGTAVRVDRRMYWAILLCAAVACLAVAALFCHRQDIALLRSDCIFASDFASIRTRTT